MTEPAHNLPELSVSDLAQALKRTVEQGFGLVRVRGEISGLKIAASGHVYLALKDEAAVLDAVMWKGSAAALRFRPEDGLEVVATGKLTTYPGRSKYQIVIERLEPAGIGALLAQLEERRQRLATEGLFDPARKRELPYIPQSIGVVTSPTGAVIRDILHRLAERFPRPVLVWPVLVQGEGAAAQIAAAIDGFNALPREGPIRRPDLLIVARGGGSVEDLWAFNEEIVVRAAARSFIPLISAVGHETDTTLIDFVADRRAPTPTAAAEIAVPVRRELTGAVEDLGLRLNRVTQRRLSTASEGVKALGRALPHPRHLLALAMQRADELSFRLPRALAANGHLWQGRYAQIVARLSPLGLRRQLDQSAEHLARTVQSLDRAQALYAVSRQRQLDHLARLLESLGYQATLRRGYAVVRAEPGRAVLASGAEAEKSVLVTVEFHDKTVAMTVKGNGAPARRSPQARADMTNQGKLF